MGSFRFDDLDGETRAWMLREWESEEASRPYRSVLFTDAGRRAFAGIMRAAIIDGDEESLASGLLDSTYWDKYHPSHTRSGKPITVEVNMVDAARRLAITEFNTAYVHGVCRRALEEGIREVEVYRVLAAELSAHRSAGSSAARMAAISEDAGRRIIRG